MADQRRIEAQLPDTFILRRRPVAVMFNRAYTDLGNVALAEYHRDRRRALSTE